MAKERAVCAGATMGIIAQRYNMANVTVVRGVVARFY